MICTHTFRFGAEMIAPFRGMSWADSARRLESLGYSTLFVPDHFHEGFGPITAMAVAAAATTTLKVARLCSTSTSAIRLSLRENSRLLTSCRKEGLKSGSAPVTTLSTTAVRESGWTHQKFGSTGLSSMHPCFAPSGERNPSHSPGTTTGSPSSTGRRSHSPRGVHHFLSPVAGNGCCVSQPDTLRSWASTCPCRPPRMRHRHATGSRCRKYRQQVRATSP